MLEDENVSRMLDILGNKNRRRIIMLLRERPCFVTEISDLLMISPKAVIDHLQLMEREQILSVRYDLNRRKYYYLSNDFQIVISPEAISNAAGIPLIMSGGRHLFGFGVAYRLGAYDYLEII